ncbi:SMI1/KNR4 family protein [Kitasatospora phosalacinea]|uniref:SMI1/KNR4 family protein n=1 Tax=Kitasatospora phosalacinea TaxID=2065 RepID=UPI000525D3CE|nr:SMI1/KNR4 family protein [Kitasatospora phosalacinea]
MDTHRPAPADLALLRDAFNAGTDGADALGWAAVHAFEAEHGVVLPEPYRTFVAEIADGSPTGPPGHGLVALAALPSDWDGDPAERNLARPFPLTAGWVWEDDEETPEEELDARVGEVHHHGSIVLGTDGCGMYWHLVVTGPHRGRVWCVTDVGATPFDAGPGRTAATTATASGFAGWVAHWHAGRPWFDADA